MLGTGDLSELALGWCTYGVGDHMSHYGVNASVPKTLIQYLVQWVSEHEDLDDVTRATLDDILQTGVSPELVPHDGGRRRRARAAERERSSVRTSCRTSSSTTCCGSASGRRRSPTSRTTPGRDRDAGDWPAARADAPRNEYDLAEICRWLRVFLQRFFSQPVQAIGAPRRAEGGLRWLVVAPGRLAGAERRVGEGVARRSSTRSRRGCSDLPECRPIRSS